MVCGLVGAGAAVVVSAAVVVVGGGERRVILSQRARKHRFQKKNRFYFFRLPCAPSAELTHLVLLLSIVLKLFCEMKNSSRVFLRISELKWLGLELRL